MELLTKLFDNKVELPKVYKDKLYSDEQRVRLGDEIKWFWKSDLWNKVIQPFTENWVLKNIEKMLTDGISLTNEEKNEIIHSARFSLALKNEIKAAESMCEVSRNRLFKKGIPR